MQKPQFVSNEIYHIYNRGVEKRDIFLADRDYLRFIHDLFEFNDIRPTPTPNIRFKVRQPSKVDSVRLRQCFEVEPQNRGCLVEILAFCLMPNHFHLLLKQKEGGGIIKFMQKLGTGYTMYFNQKYERVGSLFQGRFKAILIKNDAHFLYLPHYIHLNPLDLAVPEWREGKIKNFDKAMTFLETYRWSSYPDYIGKKNFPSITQREFILEVVGGPEQYKQDILEWLQEKSLEEIKDFLFD